MAGGYRLPGNGEHFVRYAGIMRYPDGGGLTAEEWARQEQVRLAAADLMAKRNISELTTMVKARLSRMQYRPGHPGRFPHQHRLNLMPFCNPAIEDCQSQR